MKTSFGNTILAVLVLGHSFGSARFADDEETATNYSIARLERLRTRGLLEARQSCSDIKCIGDTPVSQMVVMEEASEVPRHERPETRAVLTNFLEKDQLEDQWLDPICKQITDVDSHQEIEAGSFYYGIQGTHKRALSLTHKGEYLDLMVTWEPTEPQLLPLFDNVKVDLCKKAISNATGKDTHTLHYGAMNIEQEIQIQTPPVAEKRSLTGVTRRGRWGNTIAIINIELGDHNKEVDLFNGNGLPLAEP
ncbi:hypothetical protein BU16DRAFT_569229 [Lophium mytilinum]|uniref:Uncharacterized protein n=1 Tax=Lophium mytilinum TaxID=390894 RepID=A0A6A6RBT4_9PEZI|nr:hypothetical protein BU16DRAFT_569229 [Lophium mytilinum]